MTEAVRPCTRETAAMCSSTRWDYGWAARRTTLTTNSAVHRDSRESAKRTRAENATGLPDHWFEGSPTTRWTTPLRTLMTTSEALRSAVAASRICSRAMVWSRLAAVPASSSESSQRVQVRWTLVCACGRSRGRCSTKDLDSGRETARAPHMAAQRTERTRQRLMMANEQNWLGSSTAVR